MTLLTGTNRNVWNISMLLLRCTVGIILFVAGAGKVLGWFGGMGLETTIGMFEANMGIPAFWAYVSCFAEFVGGLLLIIGLITRPAAFIVFVNMLVATIMVGPKNFFMGGGAYPFSLMISALAIFLSGPMAYSLDALLFKAREGH